MILSEISLNKMSYVNMYRLYCNEYQKIEKSFLVIQLINITKKLRRVQNNYYLL